MWRTHSCVPHPDSSGCSAIPAPAARRRHEWRRGTHECVRHGAAPYFTTVFAVARLSYSSYTRTATVCSPGAASRVNS